ncbi:MAG TPA: lipid II flippase MurJ, partial [Mycobacteriales bacterium]|nr:lipid II flippase MurJ [Mycobacteriales bacterium]
MAEDADAPAADDVARRPHRMPPPPPRPVQERVGRPDAASALPPPPYRAAPPPSTPFGDPGPVSSLPPVPAPTPRPLPSTPSAARNRWVPAADDTQVMTSLPPVPRGPRGEREEDIEAREGAPGASRTVLRAAGTMAVATLVSRVTGLLRTMVLAAALGVLLVNDAYTTANTLPNIVYELLLGGVLTSVVVPLLVHAQEHDRDGGTAYAQRLATIATAGLVVVTGLAVLLAPLLTSLYGITDDPDQVRLANWLARILLIEIVFYGVGALAQAILNSRDVFGPPAWAPVLNNVIVIATGLLFIASAGPGELTPVTITSGQVWLLGIGTTLGIAVQALVLLPLLGSAGVPVRPRWGFRDTGLREAGSLGLWV